MSPSQFLALDFGNKRTGIARGSIVARLAEPLKTIETASLFDALPQLIKDNSVDAIVVGLPRNLNGQDTDQTTLVRDWLKQAKAKLDLPFYWQDEALTSYMVEISQKHGKHIADVDALAAAIILQDFLDTPEAERVVC